jgi:hypothetical protein
VTVATIDGAILYTQVGGCGRFCASYPSSKSPAASGSVFPFKRPPNGGVCRLAQILLGIDLERSSKEKNLAKTCQLKLQLSSRMRLMRLSAILSEPLSVAAKQRQLFAVIEKWFGHYA